MGEEANKKARILERLISGEKIACESCKNGYLEPYNASCDKAHAFICSNPECGNYVQWDPIINID